MFAIHDFWKTTLIPTINSEVQQLINSEVQANPLIRYITPVFTQTQELNDVIHFMRSLKVKWRVNGQSNKTWLNVVIGRQMLSENRTIEDLVNDARDFISWYIDEGVRRVSVIANINGRNLEVQEQNWQMIIQGIAQTITLTSEQRNLLQQFQEAFNNWIDNTPFAFTWHLSPLITEILNWFLRDDE